MPLKFVSIVVLALTVGALPPAGAQQPPPEQMTVKDLRQRGWTVLSATSRNETHPGLPPYEHLSRVISVTTYTLVRGNQTVVCEIRYDSQRDSLTEDCSQNGS